jgi:protein disulfide-isomerase/protein disulfide-isomerase A1
MLKYLSLFGGVALAQEVKVLTEANFKDAIGSDDPILVKFYAPWCGHCKSLEPEYEKAAKEMHDGGVKAALGKVDATVESKLAEAHDVRGYPTLKWFEGGSASEYDGPRQAAGIVDWIKKRTGPAVTEGEAPEKTALSVTLFAPEESEDFSAAAKKLRSKADWFWVKSDDKKVVLKHLGEPALETTDLSKDAIVTFVNDNPFPKYGPLNADTFQQYVERGNGLVWTLFPMKEDNVDAVIDEHREEMTKLATEVGKDWSITWTDTNQFGKVLESMFGVTEFPKVVVQKKGGDKKNFIYEGDITAAGVKAYLDDIASGKIKPKLKSEAAPEEPQEDPVKVIVGSTVETQVFTEDKDVLLEVYAPWCGHCKKLEPEWNKVGKKVVKEGLEDILTIAKMDGTLNDSPVDSLEWSGFPTIYYVKAGNKEPVKYDGGRDAKGIWKWVKKNHSKADVIKERLAASKSGSGSAEKKKEEL